MFHLVPLRLMPQLKNSPRLVIYVSAGFFLLGALLFYGAITLELPEAAGKRSLSLLQDAVRTADAVEVSMLSFPKAHPTAPRYHTKRFPAEYAVVGTRRLSPEQTREFLGILDQHDFTAAYGAMCHDPGFVLRFSRRGRTILTGSLCLECMNIELEPWPFAPRWISIYNRKTPERRVELIREFLVKMNGD